MSLTFVFFSLALSLVNNEVESKKAKKNVIFCEIFSRID